MVEFRNVLLLPIPPIPRTKAWWTMLDVIELVEWYGTTCHQETLQVEDVENIERSAAIPVNPGRMDLPELIFDSFHLDLIHLLLTLEFLEFLLQFRSQNHPMTAGSPIMTLPLLNTC